MSPECKKYLDELSGFYFEKRGPVEMKVNRCNILQYITSVNTISFR